MQKTIVAWISLIILIALALVLSYLKFFVANDLESETPTETSSSKAINLALKEIVENFNNDEKINDYSNQNIKINAKLNNYSIFISYQTDKLITYEFRYDNLNLSIIIDNDEENLKRFEKVFLVLNNAIQKRQKQEENIENEIHDFLINQKKIEGLTQEKQGNKLKIKVDITKKIKKENN